MPVISTKAPWPPWFIGQQGNPGAPESWRPFRYAYHCFWGLEDVIPVFTNMWNQLDTSKVVGGLWRRQDDWSFELVVVDNATAPEIPVVGTMEAMA